MSASGKCPVQETGSRSGSRICPSLLHKKRKVHSSRDMQESHERELTTVPVRQEFVLHVVELSHLLFWDNLFGFQALKLFGKKSKHAL